MVPVSIVIITKNEAAVIVGCIDKARQITDDIVVIDNGSIDETVEIAFTLGCRVYRKVWDGYGANKNKGIDAAKYNWILSIDADEIPDDDLIEALHQTDFSNPEVAYDIKFRSYFGAKPIKHGSWGRDHHIRLFNREQIRWSETLVHETLLMPENIHIKKIGGSLHHYSVKDFDEYDSKCYYYAKLSAKKYHRTGKKANAVKLYLSPLFGFFKNYIIYLGFLDGREGWDIASTNMKSTYLKYHLLNELENSNTTNHKRAASKDSFAVDY